MLFSSFFFFNDTATTEIYTLSLHDALPISHRAQSPESHHGGAAHRPARADPLGAGSGRSYPRGTVRLSLPEARAGSPQRSEEHTSELQSQSNLVCRLLLEKKKKLSTTVQLPSD